MQFRNSSHRQQRPSHRGISGTASAAASGMRSGNESCPIARQLGWHKLPESKSPTPVCEICDWPDRRLAAIVSNTSSHGSLLQSGKPLAQPEDGNKDEAAGQVTGFRCNACTPMGYTFRDICRNIGIHPADSCTDIGSRVSRAPANVDWFARCWRIDTRERRMPQDSVEYTLRREESPPR